MLLSICLRWCYQPVRRRCPPPMTCRSCFAPCAMATGHGIVAPSRRCSTTWEETPNGLTPSAMPERDALDWDSNRSSNFLINNRLQTIVSNPLLLKSRRMKLDYRNIPSAYLQATSIDEG